MVNKAHISRESSDRVETVQLEEIQYKNSGVIIFYPESSKAHSEFIPNHKLDFVMVFGE